MTDDDHRERLRTTFDTAAEIYERARPTYPEELFDELIQTTGLTPGDRLLEIGCATGKATLPLARRGFDITCVELGRDLAAVARSRLAGHAVRVEVGSFEEWPTPEECEPFDLVYAATAWHWVDPARRYPRAHELLAQDGHLAFWEAGHVIPDDGDPFFVEIQHVYDEIGEGLPPGTPLPRPGHLADRVEEIEASGLFDVVHVREFDWETSYDADGYIDLLRTFSGHIEMQPWQRRRLFGEIRERLAERPDGRLRRHWGGVFHLARRRAD